MEMDYTLRNPNALNLRRQHNQDFSRSSKLWPLFIEAQNHAKTYNYCKFWYYQGHIYLMKRDGHYPVRINSEADLAKLKEEDFLDVSVIPFNHTCFETQVQKVLEHVCFRWDTELKRLLGLLYDLNDALSEVWPDIQVIPFGSVITGLGLKSSDVDCNIRLPGAHNPQYSVIQAKAALLRNKSTFTKLFAITGAKVPILKFFHVPSRFKCDIDFSNTTSVRNSELIKFLMLLDSKALHLAILIKYWSKVHGFTGTNLLTSYALTLMVVFFLQVKYILPSVLELQQNTRSENVNDWNTSFNPSFKVKHKNKYQPLYVLLGEFFEYYKNFDYIQYAISPYLGFPVQKQLFKNVLDLPIEYDLYKNNLLKNRCDPFWTGSAMTGSAMSVQDPFEHNKNCTMAVSHKLFNTIRGHFAVACRHYHNEQNDCFLKALFTQKLVYEPVSVSCEVHSIEEQDMSVGSQLLNRYRHGVGYDPARFRPDTKEITLMRICLLIFFWYIFWQWNKS